MSSLMVLFRASDPQTRGIVELDAVGRVMDFDDKPKPFDEISPNRPFAGGGKRRPAVFLDRDGTLIEHVHYLSDPRRVRLLPGVAEAIRRLRHAGFACVLVTNQSAVGRGMITESRLHEIHAEMDRQLAERGTALDAIYYCTDVPSGNDRTDVMNDNRKPGAGMLLRAATDLRLDLPASWMVGDLFSDVLAGLNAGCRSILVKSGPAAHDELQDQGLAGRYLVLQDFVAAAETILNAR